MLSQGLALILSQDWASVFPCILATQTTYSNIGRFAIYYCQKNSGTWEYLDRLMSCTATGFMPGTLFPSPLQLGSAFLIVLTADTSILPNSIKGSSLVIKYGRGKFAISSRQSEKSHYFSYEEFCFLCKVKCCSDFFEYCWNKKSIIGKTCP